MHPCRVGDIRWPGQKRRAVGHKRQHVINRRLRVLPTCPEWLRLSRRARDTAATMLHHSRHCGESATKTIKFFVAHTVNYVICNNHTRIDWVLLHFTPVIQQNHYGNQSRGYFSGGRPPWPPTVPRLAARPSQSNPRGSGPEVLKRERGHVTVETWSFCGGGLQGPPSLMYHQPGRKFEKLFCAVDRLSCQLELSKSETSQFRSDLVYYVHLIFFHGS